MHLTAGDLLFIYTALDKGTAAVLARSVIVLNMGVTWWWGQLWSGTQVLVMASV